HRRALDPAIKSLNLLNSFLAKREAARAGARDAVLLNPDGFVAEGTASNVFFVRRGTLCTPALEAGILEGITRGIVLDLARRLGFRVREGLFRPAALLAAEEAFLTASTIELLPLAALGARRYPASRPVTRVLQSAYRVTVLDELGSRSRA
ncbi:MAG: aminotransferase class IV, partial [bacterium]